MEILFNSRLVDFLKGLRKMRKVAYGILEYGINSRAVILPAINTAIVDDRVALGEVTLIPCGKQERRGLGCLI